MNLRGEGLGLELEIFERNRMKEGETPGVIGVLANTMGANFDVDLDWIHFSPSQLLTFEPCLDGNSPLPGPSASILVLSNPVFDIATRMKCRIVYEILSSLWDFNCPLTVC